MSENLRLEDKREVKSSKPGIVWASLDGSVSSTQGLKTPLQVKYLETTRSHRQLTAKRANPYLQMAMVPSRANGGPGSRTVDLSAPVISNNDVEFVMIRDHVGGDRSQGRPHREISYNMTKAEVVSEGVQLNYRHSDDRKVNTMQRKVYRCNLLRYPRRRQQAFNFHTVGEESRVLQVNTYHLSDPRVVLHVEPKGPADSHDWLHIGLDYDVRQTYEYTTMYRLSLGLFESGQAEFVTPGVELPRLGETTLIGMMAATEPLLKLNQGSQYWEPRHGKSHSWPLFRVVFDAPQADTDHGGLGMHLLEQVGQFLEGTPFLDNPVENWMHRPMIGVTEDQMPGLLGCLMNNPTPGIRRNLIQDIKNGSTYLEANTTSEITDIVRTGQPHIRYANGKLQAINESAMLLVRHQGKMVDLEVGMHVHEGQCLGYFMMPGITYDWHDVKTQLGACLRDAVRTYLLSASIQPHFEGNSDMWLVPATMMANMSPPFYQGLFWVSPSMLTDFDTSGLYNQRFNSVIYPTVTTSLPGKQLMLNGTRLLA